jgi:hypothetical protein
MPKNISVDAASKIVEILEDLNSENRIRAVRAAMILLGDTPIDVAEADTGGEEPVARGDAVLTLPPRARTWLNQNSISTAQILQVFHLGNDGAEVIASVPGKSKREQTYNAYVLTGLGQLLSNGSATFEDQAARVFCESSGCYDKANHSVYIKNRGSLFTGSKDKGWTLTVPGLKRAAEMVQDLSINKSS